MYRKRRLVVVICVSLVVAGLGFWQEAMQPAIKQPTVKLSPDQTLAANELESLAVKGRAPKTGYTRAQFGSGWRETGDCNTRDDILTRDMTATDIKNCKVYSGTLNDPYTAKTIQFQRGPDTSSAIQIDHVVALSDAWQKGAQQLSSATREDMANDPLELLAVDGPANQNKSDGDAATWLPPNKSYRCRYVARQIAVKKKYSLWVTAAEKVAMRTILAGCPSQVLPVQK